MTGLHTPGADGTYDLDAIRRRAADRVAAVEREIAEHDAQTAAQAHDNGMRAVLVRDPQVADTERGWHVYGPFDHAQARLVAEDLAVALAAGQMGDLSIELIGWEPWEGLT